MAFIHQKDKQPKSEKIKINYQFRQLIDGLVGFVANFEKNIHFIRNDIPVFFQNTGDETYWYDKKWNKKSDEKYTEIYQRVPRCVLEFPDSFEHQIDQNGSKFIKWSSKQKTDNGELESVKMFGRRQALNIPIECNFVCSNGVLMLAYYEMFLCLLNNDNVFTYESGGNTYESVFKLSSINIIKPGIDMSSQSRNFVIKLNLEIEYQIMLANVKTIKAEKETGFDEVGFIIDSYETDKNSFYRSYLNIDDFNGNKNSQ